MSRKYQGLIILNTKSLDGSVDDLVTSISKEIEAEGAKVANIEQLGRREFAYTSRHITAGHYVNYTFEGAPDVISKLREKLALNGNVHQQFYERIA